MMQQVPPAARLPSLSGQPVFFPSPYNHCVHQHIGSAPPPPPPPPPAPPPLIINCIIWLPTNTSFHDWCETHIGGWDERLMP